MDYEQGIRSLDLSAPREMNRVQPFENANDAKKYVLEKHNLNT
jgi:hypothetical protein